MSCFKGYYYLLLKEDDSTTFGSILAEVQSVPAVTSCGELGPLSAGPYRF